MSLPHSIQCQIVNLYRSLFDWNWAVICLRQPKYWISLKMNICQKTWLKELSDSIISFFTSKMCVVLCWSFECDRCSLILLETNVGNLIRRMLFPTSQTSKFLLQHACTLNFYLAIHLIPRLTIQYHKFTAKLI